MKKVILLVPLLLIAALLSYFYLSFTDSPNVDTDSPTTASPDQQQETPASSTRAPGTTEQTNSSAFDASKAIYLGETDNGVVYEAYGKLFSVDTLGEAVEIGDPAIEKRGAALSPSGSTLIYQFFDTSNIASPVKLALLHLRDDNKENAVIELETSNRMEEIGPYFWSGQNVFVQAAHATESPEFLIFNGITGAMAGSGVLFQTLYENNKMTKLLRLDPVHEVDSNNGLGAAISVAALTEDGVLHKLLEETFYETMFVDIKISEDLTAISVWTHLVPDNSSTLWVSALNHVNWQTREWKKYDTAPVKEGFIRFDTDRRKVLLSNGEKVKMPQLDRVGH
ncbi:hypothetical protein [Paenibacillus sp. YIM B09110]|uniref:hypothetical protein n=1 Tax=Paenibacillus sp. YIM B09110 TaxID=3126102 RepID=UPI00301BC819